MIIVFVFKSNAAREKCYNVQVNVQVASRRLVRLPDSVLRLKSAEIDQYKYLPFPPNVLSETMKWKD